MKKAFPGALRAEARQLKICCFFIGFAIKSIQVVWASILVIFSFVKFFFWRLLDFARLCLTDLLFLLRLCLAFDIHPFEHQKIVFLSALCILCQGVAGRFIIESNQSKYLSHFNWSKIFSCSALKVTTPLVFMQTVLSIAFTNFRLA